MQLADTIAGDLGMKRTDVQNSNIIALVATLLTRLVAGPLCDRFGPRWTFAGCLFAGAIPTALAGAVTNTKGLLALRFFVGILGGSFVPCQVWSTGFYDKNIVGTANSITAGLGNSGGGVTYFLMPAIYDSLVKNRGMTPHQAWRVSFVVPFILIIATATLLLLLCPDCPTGKWSERHLATQQNLQAHGIQEVIVDVPGAITSERKDTKGSVGSDSQGSEEKVEYEATGKTKSNHDADHEANLSPQTLLDTARGEVIRKPTLREAVPVVLSLQTLVMASCYFCSFGAELSINSVLGNYYGKNFPRLGQTGSGKWAAMFGLLNIVFRPMGGALADLIYTATNGSLWGKKALLHFMAVLQGVFLIAIGIKDSKAESTMFGLMAGMAFFLEAGNGANYALVPHVHPHANGIISGCTGAAGNFGGIIFAIIFRYNGKDYGKVFWIIGVMTIAINLAVSWIRPVPKGQIGGR